MRLRAIPMIMTAAITIFSASGTTVIALGDEAAETIDMMEIEEEPTYDPALLSDEKVDDDAEFAEVIPVDELSAEMVDTTLEDDVNDLDETGTIIEDFSAEISEESSEESQQEPMENTVEENNAEGSLFVDEAVDGIEEAYTNEYYTLASDNGNSLKLDYDMSEGALEGEGDGYWAVRPKPGTEVTLKVKAMADDISQLTYKWFYFLGEAGGLEEIPSQGASCTVPAKKSMLMARVLDSYGNMDSCTFWIFIDNELEVYPDIEIETRLLGKYEDGRGSYYTDVMVPIPENEDEITLKVVAKAYDMESISYSWSGWRFDEDVEESPIDDISACNDTATVHDVKEGDQVCCDVSDTYGNSFSVSFELVSRKIFECDHTEYEEVVEDKATCESRGWMKCICKNCGREWSEEIPVDPDAHCWVDEGEEGDEGWRMTRPADCVSEGIMERECVRCGKTETQSIPVIDHNLIKTDAKAATTEKEGNKEYYTCSACGKVFSDAQGNTEITKESTVIARLSTSTDPAPTTTTPTTTTPTTTIPTAATPTTTTPAATTPEATKPVTKTPTVVSPDTTAKDQEVTTTEQSKKANTMTVKTKKLTVKASELKKKKQIIKAKTAFKVKNAKGKVTYKKLSGNNKIKISKGGKITLKKELKKGTYKIKVQVTAAGNAKYSAGSKTVKLKIKVE